MTIDNEILLDRRKSSVSGGLDWMLGRMSLLKEFWNIGTDSPGKWCSRHPCRCS